jgi:pimeloyl-ACP methyl ester carboxylesterase
MKRLYCSTSLGQVHCIVGGDDPRTPLLLLHQTPRSVDEYAELLPRLAQHRRVVAMDTPGYGCSDPVAAQPSIAGYAAAATEVLEALGIGRAIVVGHHTGAVIAVEMAAAHAQRVERVVLSGPVYADAAARGALRTRFRQWRIAADGSHLTDLWHAMQRWVADPALVQRLVRDVVRAGTASEQGHLAVAAYPIEERIPLVQCPALLLYARLDPFADAARAAPLRAAFRPCREASVDGGVFALNEVPEAYARAILDYAGGAP